MSLEKISSIQILEVDSLECFKLLKENHNANLIDVRTSSEWSFVGVPDLTSINKVPIFISWELYPSINQNINFKNEIIQSKIKKNDLIFFLCRSGNRSYRAAQYLATLNYKQCVNVCDGFEGNMNSNNHRSKINGWKFNKLPWKQ